MRIYTDIGQKLGSYPVLNVSGEKRWTAIHKQIFLKLKLHNCFEFNNKTRLFAFDFTGCCHFCSAMHELLCHKADFAFVFILHITCALFAHAHIALCYAYYTVPKDVGCWFYYYLFIHL